MAKKCEFRRKNSETCNADAQTGKSLCVFHDPAKASEGRRARRAGGSTPALPMGWDTSPVSLQCAFTGFGTETVRGAHGKDRGCLRTKCHFPGVDKQCRGELYSNALKERKNLRKH